jgi:mannose-6-phosphate isomerase-like protein (cupin superfamily)
MSRQSSTTDQQNHLQKFTFDKPTKVIPYGRDNSAEIGLVTAGDNTFAKIRCQPGWKWTTHTKGFAGTNSCMHSHIAFVTRGRAILERTDENGKPLGERVEYGPGDIMVAPPLHDAWVVGNEPFEAIDIAETLAHHDGHSHPNPNRND